MKKFILNGIVSCLWLTAYSQQFSQVNPDSIFGKLNKTDIKTGLLYDKVIPFSGIRKYNGVYDTVCQIENWKQIYYELFRSAVATNNMKNLDSIKQKAYNYLDNNYGANPFMFLLFRYNKRGLVHFLT